MHWHFVDNRHTEALLRAARQDMGVSIISPNDLAGRLFDPSPKLARLCQPLSPMAFNALDCLARDEIHTLCLAEAHAHLKGEPVKRLSQSED